MTIWPRTELAGEAGFPEPARSSNTTIQYGADENVGNYDHNNQNYEYFEYDDVVAMDYDIDNSYNDDGPQCI